MRPCVPDFRHSIVHPKEKRVVLSVTGSYLKLDRDGRIRRGRDTVHRAGGIVGIANAIGDDDVVAADLHWRGEHAG